MTIVVVVDENHMMVDLIVVDPNISDQCKGDNSLMMVMMNLGDILGDGRAGWCPRGGA